MDLVTEYCKWLKLLWMKVNKTNINYVSRKSTEKVYYLVEKNEKKIKDYNVERWNVNTSNLWVGVIDDLFFFLLFCLFVS